jgi:hypothetical protein
LELKNWLLNLILKCLNTLLLFNTNALKL